MKRYWIYARQAYTPRWWPSVIPAMLATLTWAYTVNPPWWLLIPGAALIGFGGSRLQWRLWRHRHPELPPEVVAREKAMWN